jgi:hypothetical protein
MIPMRSDKALLSVAVVVLAAVIILLWFVLSRNQVERLSSAPNQGSVASVRETASTPRRTAEKSHRRVESSDSNLRAPSTDAVPAPKPSELFPAFLEGNFRGANPAFVGQLFARLSYPMVRNRNYVVALPTAPLDSEGRFRFDGLREDNQVRVSIFDRTDSSRALRKSAIVHLKPGRNRIEIEALPGARLVIDLGGLSLPSAKMTALIVPVRNLGTMPKEIFMSYEAGQEQAYVREIGEAQRVVVAGARPGRYRLIVVPSLDASDFGIEVRTTKVLVDPGQKVHFWSGPTFTLEDGDSLRLSVGVLDEPATITARLASGIRFELRARDPELSSDERGQLIRPFVSGTATIRVVPGTYEYRFRYRLAGDETESQELSRWRRIDLRQGECRELELTAIRENSR